MDSCDLKIKDSMTSPINDDKRSMVNTSRKRSYVKILKGVWIESEDIVARQLNVTSSQSKIPVTGMTVIIA